MPYEYVIEAYEKGLKNRLAHLHQLEAPVTLLSSLFANSNRDSKKHKKPYTMNDFFLYQPKDDKDIPTGVYGAAAMRLVESREFPLWAYTFYKDLKSAANGPAPTLLAFSHKNAILLAPVIKEKTIKGMLISEDVVSGQVIEMTSNTGLTYSLQIPVQKSRYIAEENVELLIVND